MATEIRDIQQFITQDTLLQKLWEKGYVDVTKRTLRYWRAQEKLPSLTPHYTGEWVYPLYVMDDVIQLLHNSNQKISPKTILGVKTLENDTFNVNTITIERMTDNTIVAKYECEEGTLLEELKEGDFRGKFTGIN